MRPYGILNLGFRKEPLSTRGSCASPTGALPSLPLSNRLPGLSLEEHFHFQDSIMLFLSDSSNGGACRVAATTGAGTSKSQLLQTSISMCLRGPG